MIVRNRLIALIYRSLAFTAMVIMLVYINAVYGAGRTLLGCFQEYLVAFLLTIFFGLLVIINALDMVHGIKGIAGGLFMPVSLFGVYMSTYVSLIYLCYQIPTGTANFSLSEIMMAFIFPALAVADWLLFEEKGTVRFSYIPFYLLIQLIYVAFMMMRPTIWNDTRLPNGTYYPFDFMNFEKYGDMVWLYMLIAMVAGLAIASLTILLNNLLSRRYIDRAKLYTFD